MSRCPRALVARGNAEMKRSRFDQALTDYGEALLLDPDHIETRLKVEQIRAINRTGTKPSSFELSGERAQSD
jgi:CBS-domain-containing membrane protein